MSRSRLRILAVAGASLAVLAVPALSREKQETPQAKGAVQAHSSSTNPAATNVDLRPEIERLGLAIRDQGHRGTCSVFATTFLIEYQAARATGAKNLDFSEEYLNWAKNRANKTDFDGGMFDDILRGYRRFGIVPAGRMHYQPSFDPKDPATPARSLITSAKESPRYRFKFIKRWDNQRGMSERELQATLSLLQAGRPVATGMWWPREFQVETVEGVASLRDLVDRSAISSVRRSPSRGGRLPCGP